MTTPKQSPKPADDVAAMVEQLKAARPDRDPIYAAALMLEASDMLTRQAEREWSFCPECGSDKIHYQEGQHKQCGNCFQEWFSDVDYTDVVKTHLAKEYRDSREMIERANARATRAETLLAEAVKVLEFYANPSIYKPHPHGIGFDRRDVSHSARDFLATLKEHGQ